LYHKSKQFFFKQKKFYTMQKVIIIIAAILCVASANTINAQVANNTSEPTTTQVIKHDTLIVNNPNTVIVYQGANVPVVYAQPNAQQLIPREIQPSASKNAGARTGKVLSSTMIGGLTGMVLGGAISYNRAMNGNFADVLFAPLTTLAGAATGSLIGSGAGLCFGIALSK
jgi:hypothetical protein